MFSNVEFSLALIPKCWHTDNVVKVDFPQIWRFFLGLWGIGGFLDEV
jgi:hypothetical protein